MIYPKQINTYFADKNHPWEYTWVEFGSDFSSVSFVRSLELAGHPPWMPQRRLSTFNARDLSLELKNEMLYIARHSDQSPFHLIGHLYLLLDYLTRSSASRRLLKTGRLQDFYGLPGTVIQNPATSFIEQNFQNDISVEDIAAFCNLDRQIVLQQNLPRRGG